MEQRFSNNSLDLETLREFCMREGEVVTYYFRRGGGSTAYSPAELDEKVCNSIDEAVESMRDYYEINENGLDAISYGFDALKQFGTIQVKNMAYYADRYYLLPMSLLYNSVDVISEKTTKSMVRKVATETGKYIGESVCGYISGLAAASAVSSTGVGTVGAGYAGFLGYTTGACVGGWLGENVAGYGFDTVYKLYSIYKTVHQIDYMNSYIHTNNLGLYNIYNVPPF